VFALLRQKSSQQLNPLQTYVLIGIIISAVYFLGFVVFLYEDWFLGSNSNITGRDFPAFWTAARLIVESSASVIYDPTIFIAELQKTFGDSMVMLWPYPPTESLFLWPLGFMTYKTAYIIFAVISVITLVFACKTSRHNFFLYISACIFTPLVTFSLYMGQNGLLTSALLIAGIRLSPTRPFLAGLLFGMMIIKPQLAAMVPIYLIATHNWKAIAATSLSAGTLIITTLLVFNTHIWTVYFSALLFYSHYGVGEIFHIGMPTVYMLVLLLTKNVAAAWALQIGLSIAIAFASFHAFKKSRDQLMHFVIFAAGIALLTPYIYIYDLPILAVALICLISRETSPVSLYKILLYSSIWLLPILQLSTKCGAIILIWFYIHVYFTAIRQKFTVPNRLI